MSYFDWIYPQTILSYPLAFLIVCPMPKPDDSGGDFNPDYAEHSFHLPFLSVTANFLAFW